MREIAEGRGVVTTREDMISQESRRKQVRKVENEKHKFSIRGESGRLYCRAQRLQMTGARYTVASRRLWIDKGAR